jgi:helix-turn-helix protein
MKQFCGDRAAAEFERGLWQPRKPSACLHGAGLGCLPPGSVRPLRHGGRPGTELSEAQAEYRLSRLEQQLDRLDLLVLDELDFVKRLLAGECLAPRRPGLSTRSRWRSGRAEPGSWRALSITLTAASRADSKGRRNISMLRSCDGNAQEAVRSCWSCPVGVPGRPPVARREHRRRFWEEIANGLSSEEAARLAGVSQAVGTRWFRQGGGMPSISLAPLSGRYLSFAEREEIAVLKACRCGVREIARRIDRSASTISRAAS